MISQQKIIKILILCAVYVIAARIGLSLYAVHGFATLIWPASGIAIASLILWGRDLWPGVALGAFIVNLSIGAHPAAALGIALGNTLEAYVGVYLLQHYADFDISFGRLRDSISYIVYAGLFAPAISATVGTTSLLLTHLLTFSDQPTTWFAWWIGDMLGALVVGPLLLVWIKPPRFIIRIRSIFEVIGVALFLITANYVIFWQPFPLLQTFPYLYPVFIPIAWIALRFGVRGKTLAIFVTSVMATSAIIFGHGVLFENSIQYSLLYFQIFIGTSAGMFLIFGSIVEERRRVAEELRIHVGKLQEAFDKIRFEDEAKKEFLALLAHELRNPLSPVVSGLEIIAQQPDLGRETKGLLSSMRGQIRTMVRLVDDLLDISRISQKKLELQKEVVDLQGIMRRSARMIEPLIKRYKHSFTLSLPEENTWFEADPVRLEQIVVNLLTNAAKYTPPEGHIACIASVDDSTLTIRVRDTGIGIASEMLERVFEPFLQVEHTRTQGAGIGVGLSLSRYLAEMHGGTLKAYSGGIGSGSEFVVTIPITIHEPPAHKKLARPAPSRISHLVSRVILLIDDNDAAAKSLGKLLTMRGYETHLAFTGTEGIEAFKKLHPEIVLLDVGLPDMTGYDVARALRDMGDKDARPTIIALTGYGGEEDKQRAHEAGFDHHVTKPVSIADLEHVLTERKH
jgi:signal transduction histidine kinase/CheY-like chemotaxis protein